MIGHLSQPDETGARPCSKVPGLTQKVIKWFWRIAHLVAAFSDENIGV